MSLQDLFFYYFFKAGSHFHFLSFPLESRCFKLFLQNQPAGAASAAGSTADASEAASKNLLTSTFKGSRIGIRDRKNHPSAAGAASAVASAARSESHVKYTEDE